MNTTQIHFMLYFGLLFHHGAAHCTMGINGHLWSISSGYELIGHDLQTIVYSTTLRECAFLCSKNDRCRSFNFSPASGECDMKSTPSNCYKYDLIQSINDTSIYFVETMEYKEISLVGLPASEINGPHIIPSSSAIDGNVTTSSCTNTGNAVGAWWMVDLHKTKCIRKIVIYTTKERLVVRIGWNADRTNPICGSPVTTVDTHTEPRIERSCDLCGRYISVNLPDAGNTTLSICELQAYEGYQTHSALPSCAAIRDECTDVGSGEYVIDPDGANNGVEPFTVLCDMKTGKTIVGHDTEGDFVTPYGYEDPGSYVRNITYSVSMAQITALINGSSRCQQFIRFSCHDVKYSSSRGTLYVWWVSRDGDKMVNWGGVPTGTNGCRCSLESGCYGGGICNCDENDRVWRSDEGLLTDKSKLPVIKIHSGDTGTSSAEKAKFTLGPLECSG